MNNVEIAKMSEKDFFAFYKKTVSGGKEKKAINTASLTLDKQLERFNKAAFSKKDEEAIYKDALSV